MNKSASLPAGSVVAELLSPDLRRKLTGSTVISNSVSSSKIIFEYVCGENITQGWVCALLDKEAFKASITATDGKPAFMLAIINQSQGSIGKFVKTGKQTINEADFALDSRIFLCNETINLTTELPEETTGNYWQIIGRSISETEIFLEIGQEIEFE